MLAAEDAVLEGAQARRRLRSPLQLMNTQLTFPPPADSPQGTPQFVIQSPLNDPNMLEELLPLLLDQTTTNDNYDLTPRVNVNTAPPEVLYCLPGLQPEEVESILAARNLYPPDHPATTTASWLITRANLPPQKFIDLQRYVTGRSSVFRVQSIGYFGRPGPIARVEAVIDTAQGTPRIVYFRDITELGRGFDMLR